MRRNDGTTSNLSAREIGSPEDIYREVLRVRDRIERLDERLDDHRVLLKDILGASRAPLGQIAGLNIFESPMLEPKPRLSISPAFEWISPAERARVNAWLLDRFGYEPPYALVVEGLGVVVGRIEADLFRGMAR